MEQGSSIKAYKGCYKRKNGVSYVKKCKLKNEFREKCSFALSFLALREENLMQEVKTSKIDRHFELVTGLNKVYEAKNHDYGDSFGKSYAKYGIIAALVRMEDKWNRLNSLAMGEKQMVNDEGLKDTLLDLANYCVMTVMELEGEQ